MVMQTPDSHGDTSVNIYSIIYLARWPGKALFLLVLECWLPSGPHWLAHPAWSKLGAMYNDVTSGLLADVTVTMVILTVEHGQMAFLDYGMTSWDNTITSGCSWRHHENHDLGSTMLTYRTGFVATHHRPDHANQESTGCIEESNLSTKTILANHFFLVSLKSLHYIYDW